jgi:hypothetical protein
MAKKLVVEARRDSL